MERTERDKICKSCINHKIDERYGIICGLTDNLANFIDECRDYSKTQKPVSEYIVTETKATKRKEKKGLGSLIGGGVALWIIFKILLKIIKAAVE